jgi:hypothetical protein
MRCGRGLPKSKPLPFCLSKAKPSPFIIAPFSKYRMSKQEKHNVNSLQAVKINTNKAIQPKLKRRTCIALIAL